MLLVYEEWGKHHEKELWIHYYKYVQHIIDVIGVKRGYVKAQIEGASRNEKGEEGVQGRGEQEHEEESVVAFADAGAHPRTVVVVSLDARPAHPTMERPRRPQHPARLTEVQFVCVRILVVSSLIGSHWQ